MTCAQLFVILWIGAGFAGLLATIYNLWQDFSE
jgi:hypothetical protein